ncbi:MAG: hypothetical protein GC187_06395 [Alphaproteobacteria bacterium]|nr:hypothetical protein [Alphaproteobacteria bacterium]
MFDIAIPCDNLSLARLNPTHREYVYEYRRPDGQAVGSQTRYQVAQAGPGSWRVSERFSSTRPGVGSGTWHTNFRYAILPEQLPPASAGYNISYEYGTAVLADVMVLEAGETVELPVTLRLRREGEETLLSDAYTISHEGCTSLEIRGESVLVHRVRIDRFFEHIDRSGEVQIRRSETFKDYAPQYGWWVREFRPGAGELVLVNVWD